MRAPNQGSASESEVLSDVVQTLTNMNCDANLALVERTRCAVRETALAMHEKRLQMRRNMGFALAALICLLILLGPAIWNSIDDLEDLFGEDLGSLPSQVALFLLMLASAILAALVAFWKEQRDVHHQRRGF
jgi:hypothetical protein